jgi:hypothetical protein
MAASYPGAIYPPRTKSNKVGEVYDASKETLIFAEDIVKLDEEVVAVENELGTNIKGGFDDLKARIVDLEARVTALEGG